MSSLYSFDIIYKARSRAHSQYTLQSSNIVCCLFVYLDLCYLRFCSLILSLKYINELLSLVADLVKNSNVFFPYYFPLCLIRQTRRAPTMIRPGKPPFLATAQRLLHFRLVVTPLFLRNQQEVQYPRRVTNVIPSKTQRRELILRKNHLKLPLPLPSKLLLRKIRISLDLLQK